MRIKEGERKWISRGLENVDEILTTKEEKEEIKEGYKKNQDENTRKKKKTR